MPDVPEGLASDGRKAAFARLKRWFVEPVTGEKGTAVFDARR